MAACIVCNQQTLPDDSKDVVDMAGLRKRLERVLKESVPIEVIICASCQFDLAQIEMYYALLRAFRRRYSETAKLRIQVDPCEGGDTKSNLLHQTAAPNLLAAIGARDSNIESPFISDGTNDGSHLPIPTSFDNSETPAKETSFTEDMTWDSDSDGYSSPIPENSEELLKEDTSSSTPAKKRGRYKKRSSGSKSRLIYDSEAEDINYEPKLSDSTSSSISGESEQKKSSETPQKDPDPNMVPKVRRPRIRKVPPVEDRTCTICDKVLSSLWKLKYHMKMHTNERPFSCTVCGKAFKARGDLNAHMKLHGTEKLFTCDICGKAFLHKGELDKHSIKHSDVRPYPCEHCEKRFKTQHQVKDHIRKRHTFGKTSLCNKCGKAFYTEYELQKHLQTHNEMRDRPFKCDICGKSFIHKTQLDSHKSTHESKETRKKYLCPICGKGLLQPDFLKLHIAKHKGETEHFCADCNKYFTSNSEYQRHMLVHQDIKLKQCSECGKEFRTTSHLNMHMKTHTDERPCVCTCGQAFREMSKLKKHMKTQKHRDNELKAAQSAAFVPQMDVIQTPVLLPLSDQ